jgi:hypothetical protein
MRQVSIKLQLYTKLLLDAYIYQALEERQRGKKYGFRKHIQLKRSGSGVFNMSRKQNFETTNTNKAHYSLQ